MVILYALLEAVIISIVIIIAICILILLIKRKFKNKDVISLKGVKTVINTIKKLVNVPIKYFSAKFLSSICLKRAILFAVKTKPISPN